MKKKNVRITCVQIHTVTNKKRENMDKMKRFGRQALTQYPDTDLLLYPEYALTGCECGPAETRSMAETLDGSSIKEMAAFAAENKIFIVFGFIELEEKTNKIYNSAVLIDDQGNIRGQYRKMHLVEEEKALVAPGNSDYPVFDTKIGKIGILICWDSAFPETARILALKGADYLLIPSAWEKPQQHDWDLVQEARAFDNVIYTACCNQVGKDFTLDFFGKSQIHGPNGQLLTDVIEDKECIISSRFCYMDKEPLRSGYYSLLKDRRPETYHNLVQKG